MLRLWKMSYMRPVSLWTAGMVSLVTHSLVVGGWAAATLPPPSMAQDGLFNRVYYMPPPDRPIPARGSHEAVTYVAFAEGTGIGPGPATLDEGRPVALSPHSRTAGAADADSVETPIVAPPPAADSVFTILEVDSAVVRSQTSAAPAYPLDLLSKGIQGSVIARYVVDTTGFADTESFVVVQSTDDGFIRAVQDALPYMRFSPAKMGLRKVRQLVEQSFTFRINPAIAATPKP
jgi:protein TonB